MHRKLYLQHRLRRHDPLAKPSGPSHTPRTCVYPGRWPGRGRGEHTWFDPEPRTGRPAWVEAGRCLRLYPHNRVLAVLAATTWLPYGDLHHYAHSAHPSVRWNYLRPLERHLGKPHFTPESLLLGPGSVAHRHFTALQPPAHAPVPQPTPTS